MSQTQTPTFSAKYRAEFANLENFDAITAQAVSDQQAGIAANTARSQYATVAEQSHYVNSWVASIKANGPTR
jgi:hypothetical protein